MSICKEIEEGCNLPSSPNDIKVLLKQLITELDSLTKNTEAKLLLHDGKIAELCRYLKDNLSNSIRCMFADMEMAGELNNIIFDVISNLLNNVKSFGAVGDGVTDDTNAFKNALKENKTVYVPNGTYIISSELVIPDNCVLIGENEKATIIKSNNSKRNIKSVIRLSRSNVGEDTTEAVSGINLENITIDAEGCDYGLYCNYVTNESKVKNVTVINATKCNICIVKSWFASFENLTAKKGKNIGISLGIKQNNEVEVSLNAIKFSNLRAHGNGTDLTHDQTSNIERGCGIIIGGCNNCDFDIIQSELNYGIGVIFKCYNTNHFNSVYIENNSRNQVNRYGLYQTSQTTSGQIIEKINLAKDQTILNESKLIINNVARVDGIRTFYGEGTNYIDYMEYTVLSSQTDFTKIAYEWKEIYSKKDVNLRYGDTLKDVFLNGNNVGYPFLVIIPKESLESSTNLTVAVNGTSYTLGKSFTANTPIFKRLASLKRDTHINEIVGSIGVSADLNANVQIGYFSYGTKKDTLPIKPF